MKTAATARSVHRLPTLFAVVASLGVAACGGGSGTGAPPPPPPPPPPTHAIGGGVNGLLGSGLVLQDNGRDDLPIASDGAFSFPTPVAEGGAYLVTVKTQPANPAQACAVVNGSGTVGTTDVDTVQVRCTSIDTRPLQLSLSANPNAALGTLVPYVVTETQGIALATLAWTFDGVAGGHAWPALANGSLQVWNTPGAHAVRVVATAADGRSAEASATVQAVGQPLAAGSRQACALAAAGGAKCWGNGVHGELGNGLAASQSVPVDVIGLALPVGLAAGDGHACAVDADGSVACWGDNTEGQLGNAMSYLGGSNPAPVAVDGLAGAIALAAGRRHSCALKGDGSVACFGRNGEGELGTGSVDAQSVVPVPVAGLVGVVAIAAGGGDFTCALKSDTTVACWGDNTSGQLGQGTVSPSFNPTPQTVLTAQGAPLSGVLALRAGGSHACAVLDDGQLSVTCWGGNAAQQVAAGDPAAIYPATVVPGLAGTLQLTLSLAGSCALDVSGAFRCWGANDFGEADGSGGTSAAMAVPNPVVDLQGLGLFPWSAGGDQYVCAVLADGGASCLGRGADGELGNGQFVDAPTVQPVLVPPGTFLH